MSGRQPIRSIRVPLAGAASLAEYLSTLQAIYRCNELPLHTRMRAAMACLPFETPKLLATAIVNGQDFATLLDQRIARYQQRQLANNAKLIEAQPINSKPTEVENQAPSRTKATTRENT